MFASGVVFIFFTKQVIQVEDAKEAEVGNLWRRRQPLD
jgi:hypothetical protein